MNEPIKQIQDFSVEVSSEPTELTSAELDIAQAEAVKFSPCEAEARDSSSDSSSVRVDLQTSGLAFHVETQIPHNAQIVELTARLDVLQDQVNDGQKRLEQAWQHIGYLEAQVQQRDQIIDHLCKEVTP